MTIAQLGGVLFKVVRETEEYKFQDDGYQCLLYWLRMGDRATAYDVCRFAMRYLPALFTTAKRTFRRNLLLDQVRARVKIARACASVNDNIGWQLTIDQVDWYLHNGHCLTDVFAQLVEIDEHAARVVHVLQVIDSALAPFLCVLCQKPLWIPSPEQRWQDLQNRLEIVSALGDGQYALSRPAVP